MPRQLHPTHRLEAKQKKKGVQKNRRLQNPGGTQKKRGAKKQGKMGEGKDAAPKSEMQGGCGTRQVAD